MMAIKGSPTKHTHSNLSLNWQWYHESAGSPTLQTATLCCIMRSLSHRFLPCNTLRTDKPCRCSASITSTPAPQYPCPCPNALCLRAAACHCMLLNLCSSTIACVLVTPYPLNRLLLWQHTPKSLRAFCLFRVSAVFTLPCTSPHRHSAL